MTINYCDYTLGNDTTGGGSAGNPYKTIDKASTGLGGGDEVRCAKGAAPTSLTGTLTWTDASATISTSDDLTGELAAMDFIGKNTAGETWWEISSLDASSITLVKAYVGTTEGVASYKLGVIDTGTAAGTTTNIQRNYGSGASVASRLLISGGWNLTTETQDGETWFWQSGANKYGRGLYSESKSYIEVSAVNFLRYYYGCFLYNADYSYAHDITVNSNSRAGLSCNYMNYGEIEEIFACVTSGYGNATGVEISNSGNVSMTNLYIYSSAYYSMKISTSYVITVNNASCLYDTSDSYPGLLLTTVKGAYLSGVTVSHTSGPYAISLQSCRGIEFGDLTCEYNTYGIRCDCIKNILINVLTTSNNSSGDFSITNQNDEWYDSRQGELPILCVQHYNAAGSNISYCSNGSIARDTVEALSDSCIQFTPSSSSYYIATSLNAIALSSRGVVFSMYMKKDATFNGDAILEVWFLGKLVAGPTTLSLTTSYVKQNMTISSVDITEDGVLDFRIRVSGTTGYVYADNFSWVFS